MTTLCVPDVAQRRDLTVFVHRVLRLDAAAVIRLRTRSDDRVGAWVATAFDVLACRVVTGSAEPRDFTCSADALRSGLRSPDERGCVDTGYPMDSAWRTGLPPESGFVHIDDVPAGVFAELARSGAELGREHAGPYGPPASLLDQEVLSASSEAGSAAVPMRCVMALAAMGFAPDTDGDVVRIRITSAWLRIDARYGSVFRRRGDPALLMG